MELSLRQLLGFSVYAGGERDGTVADVYLDDRGWMVRLVEIHTGTWWRRKHVAVATDTIASVNRTGRTLALTVGPGDLERFDTADRIETVSRAHDREIHQLHQWPYYWRSVERIGPQPVISDVLSSEEGRLRSSLEDDEHTGSHLRSLRELLSYRMRNSVERVGAVADILVDDHDWRVIHFAARSGPLRSPVLHLVPRRAVSHVSWRDKTIIVKNSRNFSLCDICDS